MAYGVSDTVNSSVNAVCVILLITWMNIIIRRVSPAIALSQKDLITISRSPYLVKVLSNILLDGERITPLASGYCPDLIRTTFAIESG